MRIIIGILAVIIIIQAFIMWKYQRQIKDICRRAADVGGVGDRYTCMIQGKERELWFEDGRWFVAAKVAVSQEPPSNA